jgi:hypothetical protein
VSTRRTNGKVVIDNALRDGTIAGKRSFFAIFIERFWKSSFVPGGGGLTMSHDHVLQWKGRRDWRRSYDM